MARGGLLPGKKEKLLSLVDYQQGSVVSRALIDRREGTVTVFAFDKGEGLSEHTAPYDALVYILEGEALVAIGGRPNEIRTGETIVLPTGEPHGVRAVGRFKMLLTMIRG